MNFVEINYSAQYVKQSQNIFSIFYQRYILVPYELSHERYKRFVNSNFRNQTLNTRRDKSAILRPNLSTFSVSEIHVIKYLNSKIRKAHSISPRDTIKAYNKHETIRKRRVSIGKTKRVGQVTIRDDDCKFRRRLRQFRSNFEFTHFR